MWGHSTLQRRIKNLEKKLPKPKEDISYLIEVSEDGGYHYKIVNGEKITINQMPSFKPEDSVTINVNIV